MKNPQHVTRKATTVVRRFGSLAPIAWVTVSDEGDEWALTGSFLDLFLFAERLAAQLLEVRPDGVSELLVDDGCCDPHCPCRDEVVR